MRFIGFIFVSLILFAGIAQAQIAAPLLNPLAIEGTVVTPGRVLKPINPAVLSWSGSSRMGGAIIELEASDVVGGVDTGISKEGDGKVLLGRFVGEFLSVGVEVYQHELTDTQTGDTNDFDGSMVSVALQFAEMISIGAGQQEAEFSDHSFQDLHSIPVAGVTLRLAEVFYLGAASGTETHTKSDVGLSQELDRAVTRVGVAYHMRNGDNGIHAEVYQEAVASGEDVLTGFTDDEEASNGFTVELVFANILLGVQSIDTETTSTADVVIEERSKTTLSLGWVPEEGLSLVANMVEEEQTDPTSGDQTLLDTAIIGVGWLF